jgi:Secretion system C-terminal sorting domain
MKRCFVPIVLLLSINSWLIAQNPSDLRTPPLLIDRIKQHFPEWMPPSSELPAGLRRNFPQKQKSGRTARTSGTSKLPLQYTHQKWDQNTQTYKTDLTTRLEFSSSGDFKAYSTEGNNVVRIDEVAMASDFKNADILDFLLPTERRNLLKSLEGGFSGSFLKSVTQKKIGNNFIIVNSAEGREEFPFPYSYYNYRYSDTFYLDICKPNTGTWEHTSRGKIEEGLWVMEIFVAQKNCQTNAIVREWREIMKFDARGNLVEMIDFLKQNDVFELIDHFKYGFDDQNRELGYEDVFKNEKTQFEYDEFEGILFSRFSKNGMEWIQTSRTIRGMTTAADETIITYTYQRKVNDQWIDVYRYVNQYNEQKQLLMSSLEYYNSTTQLWDMDHFFRRKLDGDKVKEYEFYSGNSGSKEVYEFDSEGNRTQYVIYTCDNKNNCFQGIYESNSIRVEAGLKYDEVYDYALPGIGTVDYQRTWSYTNGEWSKLDSTANVYDIDGDLVEVYNQRFSTNERERHQISYRSSVTTAVNDEIATPLIAVYPNPIRDKFTLKTTLTDYTVRIYDLKGNPLGKYADVKEIDMSAQPPGMYILFVESREGQQRLKISKY